MAVLGATAGLQADDALNLDLRAAPAHAHLVSEREQLFQAIVRKLQDSQHLLLRQAHALFQDLLTGDCQYVGVRRGCQLGCLSHAGLLTRYKPDTQS
ncbi:Uncharacterised protein [Mycobacteroides abscessus subsp. abscessus]|nr:Uncharacterised protein [Mycobacteroides abscessus subsp. abscessus]SHU70280.1 Uncharacterised protein [Mycobacteroides abscessus subsp. abscessus]SIN44308.1 Uncharacterised protein [Mycobacteroides abscessus subsp. abscessus]